MRFLWLIWLAKHFGEYGYSHGPLRGAIGTVAVLLTALLIGIVLWRRTRAAAVTAAGLTCVVGVGWLALH